MPVPPFVCWGLWVPLWRVFPKLLTAERCHIEVAPGGPHRLVSPAVDEVRAGHLVAVAEECIVAMPLIDAVVHVKAVGDGVPRYVPLHPRLQAGDIRLR